MTTEVDPSLNGHAVDADSRVRDALGHPFSDESLRVLAESAIPVESAIEYGVRAVAHPDHVPDEIDRYWVVGPGRGPGMVFEWRDQDRTVPQFRPDKPVRGNDGDDHKYVLPGGCGVFLSHWRAGEDGEPVLVIEGTKQSIAGAVWAPESWGIVGVPGCNNWMGTDLTWAEGRDVVVLFDGDVTTNRNVHDAAVQFKAALEADGATSVSYATLAGARAKEGLDDVLGRRPADKRTDYIKRIVLAATKRLGRPPARKSENPYMGDKGLLAKTAALAVLDGQPAALGSGSQIALYRDGVFMIENDDEPLLDKVTALLQEEYRPTWRATIEDFLVGELFRRGMRLPDRTPEPLLNCKNGMLDLRTGELKPHDPSYLSAQQIPVAWDPAATCPKYLAWLKERIPDQYLALEEVASTMLDPSRTPAKALFAFGPSHSGKSTFLRILVAMAGYGNVSGVSLHQLADNKFMAAPIYKKMVNVAADLSSAHVADLSLFKMMSGEDLIEADRKYGKPFRFTNQALFAFSANELPTVSENSDAYTNRIAPFLFPFTFAGREDPTVEDGLMAELPGILVRWVKAWQGFRERGGYLPANAAVAQEFETRSDRVARFVATRCDVFPEMLGKTVGADQGSSVQDLYTAFRAWVEEDGSKSAMTRPKFSERVRGLRGVGDVTLRHKSRNKGLNVVTHDRDDAEIGYNRTKAASECVDCVGCVGCETSSPYVRTESELIMEERGAKETETYGKDVKLPTQPTHGTQPAPTSEEDEIAAFLGAGVPTQPTQTPTAAGPSDEIADYLADAFGDYPAPRAEQHDEPNTDQLTTDHGDPFAGDFDWDAE